MNRYRVINRETGTDYGELIGGCENHVICEVMYLHSISDNDVKNIIAGQINPE
jgi:hypothetical protein